MTQRFQAPKGVPEYVPPESGEFLAVRSALTRSAELAGYAYIELPVFEDATLFARGVGESTDVVSKEMYTFHDRGGRPLALRPEGTAGVVRSVIQHGLHNGQLPVKLYYAGPFFRAERPQKGRYRQLQQVGVEAIGTDDPAVDAEVITVADAGFRSLGLTRFDLLLTSLGCAECRPAYRQKLTEFLETLELDDETRARARLNPLRVLDDKRREVRQQLAGVPVMVDNLCDQCQDHYDHVREYLRLCGVGWTEDPHLVRGLDYYTRTTFEFSHPLLGAQSGIGGGGRYDGLMQSLGGPPIPGIGFGLGTDRTLLAREAEGLAPLAGPRVVAYGVPLGDAARAVLVPLAAQLREAGIATDLAYGGRGLKGAMKGADRSGAAFALIVGDAEAAQSTVQVKHLATGHQVEVPVSGVIDHLREASHAQNP